MTHLIDRDEVLTLLNIVRQDSSQIDNAIDDIFSLATHEDRVKQLIKEKYEKEFKLHLENVWDREQEAKWEGIQELLNELYPNN